MTTTRPKFTRRRAAISAVVGVAALLVTACGGGSTGAADGGSSSADAGGGESASSSASTDTGGGWTPYQAEPGTEVPAATVKFGMRPYADNTFWEIGIKKGWFGDVGITLDPPEGISTTEDQWTNLLLEGSTDINSSTCAILLTTYSSSDQLKCIQHAVTFYGAVMFANPKLGLKSLQDYVDEGQDFDTALKSALEPMVGKDVYVPPGTGEVTFNQTPFDMAGLEYPNFQPTSDSDMFTQAQAGQIDFLHPGGAPIAIELLKLGWTPIYDTRMLVENGPTGADSPLAGLVLNNGIAATADYAAKNEDTVLRFTSVMYRIAAETAADPSLFDLQAPYLNSVAGTNLTGAEIADLFKNFHPLTTFDEAAAYYQQPDSAEYYKSIGDAVVKAQEEIGSIPSGLDADSFIWADDVYTDLVTYKQKADEIFASADDTADAALMAKAQQYYDWYDYLDAYRFAAAATGK